MLLSHGSALTKKSQLIKSKEHHQNSSHSGKEKLVALKEGSQCGEPQSQEEEGKADADDETEGVKHYLSPLIVHAAVLTALAGSAGKIPDV